MYMQKRHMQAQCVLWLINHFCFWLDDSITRLFKLYSQSIPHLQKKGQHKSFEVITTSINNKFQAIKNQ